MPRFYAYSVPDWTLVDNDMQLSEATITRAISTPKALDATVSRQYAHLNLREWGTVIAAEHAGRIDVFIVDGLATQGEREDMTVSAGGVASFIKGQPFLAANTEAAEAMAGTPGWRAGPREISGVDVDPLDMVRAIWRLLLAAPRSDIRLTVDSTRSPVRIGEEERDVSFQTGSGDDVEFTAGPYKLSWHGTDDCGSEMDSLADETPFEWWEESRWADGLPTTRLRIAYPRMATARKPNLFFEVGANIVDLSTTEWHDHADVVLVTGEGEGSKRVRSHMSEPTDKLRRVHVEADRGIINRARAQERARELLKKHVAKPVISSITVVDSPAARFGTYTLGDTITVRGTTGWVELQDDYRIVSINDDYTAERQTLGLEEV